jgi:hypothetical protein
VRPVCKLRRRKHRAELELEVAELEDRTDRHGS